ncbi:MAG: hypothetical protein QXF61_07345 [Nitrososphaeria archaeon]
MTWVLKEKLFWIIIIAIALVCFFPFLVVEIILILPPTARLVVTVLIIIGWGFVAGYREWVIAKRKEEEQKSRNRR